MKKILSTLLAAAMLVGTFTLGAMSVSGAELTATGVIGDQSTKDDGHGGFIDSNLTFGESLNVDKLEDITIEVNGKPAYWNIGYMGYKHCQLGSSDGKVAKNWIQIGIVGAEIKKSAEKDGALEKDNTIKLTMGKSGDTYTQTFASNFAAKGVARSVVTADKTAKTVEAVITYNNAPGYKVGDTLDGECHDDHNNTGKFTVTKVDGNTVTLKAENYVPTQSLLELVDKDGVYTTVTINTAKVTTSDPQALSADDTKAVREKGTKQTLSEVTCKETATGKDFSTAANLTDGKTGTKIEGGFPTGGVTITFQTSAAVKATYLVLSTHDDDQYKNRAPQAFTLSGSTDGKTYTVIKDVVVSGIQNEKETPFAFALKDAAEYKYYKLEISSYLGGGYFQVSEMELYSGNVTLTGTVPAEDTRVETQKASDSVPGIPEYNGTAPATPPTQGGQQGGTDKPDDKPTPPPTGDIALVLSVIALIAVAGAVVIAKKRKIEE